MHRPSPILPRILPVGTAVVIAVPQAAHTQGTAGIIIAAPVDPDHAYRVRFPGGDEISLLRREIQVLSHFQNQGFARVDPLIEYDLYKHVIYRCIIGSRAYGLDRDGSDTDRRGIYLPPASMHWSVYGVPEQLDNPETQECYWELEKFIKLALKGNPNVLEVLYSPLIEHADPIALVLREERSIFLSRLIYQTFNGYAMSQFRKIELDIKLHASVKWKHAMHLIRLLRSGIAALRTGELPVRVEHNREELLQIRDGLMPWDFVDTLRKSLHDEFERAFESSSLPDRPNYERANEILVAARAEMAKREKLI